MAAVLLAHALNTLHVIIEPNNQFLFLQSSKQQQGGKLCSSSDSRPYFSSHHQTTLDSLCHILFVSPFFIIITGSSLSSKAPSFLDQAHPTNCLITSTFRMLSIVLTPTKFMIFLKVLLFVEVNALFGP